MAPRTCNPIVISKDKILNNKLLNEWRYEKIRNNMICEIIQNNELTLINFILPICLILNPKIGYIIY